MRYYEKILKLFLGLSGAGLLLLMFPRRGPWEICNIVLHTGAVQSFVEFRFPFVGSFTIGYFPAILLCAAILPVATFLFHTVRSSAAQLFGHKSACLIFFAALFLFGITYLSGLFLREKIDEPTMLLRSVTLYLTFGLYGVVFLFAGISRHIAGLSVWSRFRSWVFTARLPLFLALLFSAEFLLTNLISYFAFEHLPHIQDSFAHVFQGTIFASGRLSVPSPPFKELFFYEHVINNGQWYSQYPPGHSFLMMLGVLAGAAWIVNPLLGSATVVALYFLGRELYSDAIGRVAAILAFFSPFILFMSSEFMNHASGLLLFTVFILFYARTLRLKSLWSGLIAGAALGWFINIRPLSAAALALPFMLYAGWLLWKRFRSYCAPFLALAIPALLFIGVLLGYNYLTNGAPLLFGYQVLHGNDHLPGFGHAAWGKPHTLELGVLHTLNNFVGLNKYLFEWPIPSLLFVFILFASGRADRRDILLVSSFFCLALGYLTYWYQDWCFGPRFLYEASGCLILLTARGFQSAPFLIKKVFGRPISVKRIYGVLTAIIIFCLAYGLITNVPALYKVYSRSYWGMDGKLIKEVQQKNIQKAVVFVRDRYPLMPNSPFLNNGIIYVWDSEKLRKDVMAIFPGYRYFLGGKNHIEEIFP